MSSPFVEAIKSNISISAAEEKSIQSLLITKTIAKGEVFIEEGQYPTLIGFVNKGLFRYFYRDENGNEYTKGFFPEYTLLSSYSAMIENRESYFTIQALEDSVIETLSFNSFLELRKQNPLWNHFLIAMLEKGFIAKERRERELLLFDAETRYTLFFERFPGLDERVKQHQIASYLGITPISLSRIRKKMGLLT